MILTCEQCKTRYLVASSAIGEEGRMVRCTNCGHEWRQEYEHIDAGFIEEEGEEDSDFEKEIMDIIDAGDLDVDPDEAEEPLTAEETGEEEPESEGECDEVPEDLEAGIESIPEGVKPVGPDSDIDVSKPSRLDPRFAGFTAAAVLLLLSLLALVFFKTSVVKAWPPAAGAYDMIGLSPTYTGEGLIIDRVRAESGYNENGVRVLTVTGAVINLQDQPQAVPDLQYKLQTEGGDIFDVWTMEPPAESLAPGEEAVFKARYPDITRDIRDVVVRFVPELR